MRRAEAIARQTEIRKQLNANAAAQRGLLDRAKVIGVEAASAEQVQLRAEAAELEAEFKAVGKFRQAF